MPFYSHSRISMFENCPKAYYFQYIEKPEIELAEGIEAFMGKRVHETLQKLYEELKFTKLNSLEELLSFYKTQWEENWNDSIVIVRDSLKPEHYLSTGKRCIENYYKRHSPFDNDRTIACEMRVSFPLDKDEKYIMRGYIDRLAEEEKGHYVIHDYKTSASLPLQEYIDRDRQLALYAIAVYSQFNDADDVNLCWHYLAFDKDLCSTRTEEQLESLKAEVLSVISRIEETEEANEFPANKSELCPWCAYRELCPAQKHHAKVEKLAPGEFRKDEGVSLANSFIELDSKIRKTEAELDLLRQRIFAYAEKYDVERVSGSDADLKLQRSKYLSFSGLKEAELLKLEEILRQNKLLERFTSLDTRSLGSAVLKKELGREASEQIKGFGEEKEMKSVRVVRK